MKLFKAQIPVCNIIQNKIDHSQIVLAQNRSMGDKDTYPTSSYSPFRECMENKWNKQL